MTNLDEFINSLDKNKADYNTGKLVEAFQVAGHPKSDSWIFRQENKGNLKLPRSTTNYKKVNGKVGFVRELSPMMIKNIVLAFIPGGKGFYDYQEDN
jgi:hypothetical protein